MPDDELPGWDFPVRPGEGAGQPCSRPTAGALWQWFLPTIARCSSISHMHLRSNLTAGAP
jgi:hypothetical protein